MHKVERVSERWYCKITHDIGCHIILILFWIEFFFKYILIFAVKRNRTDFGANYWILMIDYLSVHWPGYLLTDFSFCVFIHRLHNVWPQKYAAVCQPNQDQHQLKALQLSNTNQAQQHNGHTLHQLHVYHRSQRSHWTTNTFHHVITKCHKETIHWLHTCHHNEDKTKNHHKSNQTQAMSIHRCSDQAMMNWANQLHHQANAQQPQTVLNINSVTLTEPFPLHQLIWHLNKKPIAYHWAHAVTNQKELAKVSAVAIQTTPTHGQQTFCELAHSMQMSLHKLSMMANTKHQAPADVIRKEVKHWKAQSIQSIHLLHLANKPNNTLLHLSFQTQYRTITNQ